jgi:trans-2,3-dihydro-3-hydroxyanthranilate isomerase
LGGARPERREQGRPEFGPRPQPSAGGPIAEAFGLTAAALHPVLRPAVVSTGLRYLIVPVTSADVLGRARIVHPDLDGLLPALGADFAYLLAPDELEGRHWNNDGIVEDVATGGAPARSRVMRSVGPPCGIARHGRPRRER